MSILRKDRGNIACIVLKFLSLLAYSTFCQLHLSASIFVRAEEGGWMQLKGLTLITWRPYSLCYLNVFFLVHNFWFLSCFCLLQCLTYISLLLIAIATKTVSKDFLLRHVSCHTHGFIFCILRPIKMWDIFSRYGTNAVQSHIEWDICSR